MAKLSKIVYWLLFVMLAALLVRDVINYDIWWHLRLGEYVMESQSVPRHEIFSYPLAGREWVDIHWLYQLMVYAIFNYGGFAGLILFKTVVYLCAFFILTRIDANVTHSPALALVFVIGTCAAYERLVVRPEMMSAFFLAAFIFVLHRFKQRGGWYIWCLPIIQVIWTNVQGLFVLGPIMMILFVLGELLHPLRIKLLPGTIESRLSKKDFQKSLVVLALVLSGCFINPYLHKGALYPLQFFKFLGQADSLGFSTTIMEFVSPFRLLYHNETLYWYVGLLVLSLVVIITPQVNIFSSWQLLAYAFFLVLSVLARRNILFFAIVALPLLAIGLNNMMQRGSKTGHGHRTIHTRLQRAAALGLLILIAAITADHLFRFYERRHGMELGFWQVREESFPEEATEFV